MTTGGTSQTKMLAAEPLRAQMGLDELPETCPDPPPRVVASALAARLLRCSPLFAVIRPGDGCVLHSNDNFRTFAGVGGPVEGRSIDDLFDSAGERDALRTALDRAVAEGEPAVRRSVSDDDAHDVAWSVEAAPVAGEEGTDAVVVHGFVGGGTADFSRGPFGDAVLDEGVSAEDLIGSTFEAIDDAIFVVAVPERVVAACNSAATDMFGYPREEIVGASTEVLHVDSERARRFGELIAEPLEETGSFRGDFTMQRADDTTFPTEHVVSYIEPEDGADPTHVVSVVRDMTERAEAERRLRESEEKFSKAFHLNPLALAILSVDEAEFLEVNAGFTRLTGYDPAEVVGRRDSESGLWVRESDRLEVARRVVDEGSIREYETRLRRSDGELRDVLVSVERTDFGGRARLLVALRDVTQRREYERKLERRAVKDPLTGLPNRTLLRDRLEHAVEQSRDECTEVAVAVVDLVRFRDVNQTLGHAAGDELLRECARRLSASVDDAVTVARIGADDFVVLFEKVGGVGAVEERCRRLMSSVTEPCRLAGTVVHPEVSVGVATSGAGASDADTLLRYAETALSKAKSSEGTAVSTFEPDSDASSADRLHRENELREAVSNREFTVRYQPIVEIESGAVLGVEALVRWDHPERGIVSPGQFLDLAEQTGLIVPIGYQVLEESTRCVAEWLERSSGIGGDRPFRLSVNISASQFQQPDVASRVEAIADGAGLPLEHLVLEVTESVLVTRGGRLDPLRERGLGVAIDDFGTGYSSLQYLRQLAADALKIDRSFVRGLPDDQRDRILIESMIDMGRKFDLAVVVEGIESDAQRRLLADLGASIGQGYHFARPMTGEAVAREFLSRS